MGKMTLAVGCALLPLVAPMRERRLCLASCNLAGLTGRHHPQPYRSFSPSPSSLSSPSSSSFSSSYQSTPTVCSSRPTLPPLARSIVTSLQLLPHALKPSVPTGFFSLPDEHQGECVGRPTSICTGARWIYPLTLADPEGRCRQTHGIPSGPRPTFDPTWILLYVAEHLHSETPHLVYIRTTMLVSLHILYTKCACQCHC